MTLCDITVKLLERLVVSIHVRQSRWSALHFVTGVEYVTNNVQEFVGCEFPIPSSLQKQELLGKIVARTRGGTALSGVATTTLGSHIPSNTSMAMYAHHGPMF